jgi:uncharacterized membrane protein HdeD (DUF308 family)
MRIDRPTVLRYRALFGLGFIILGLVMVTRVVVTPAPANSKVLGALLGLAILALGVARVVQYAKARREMPR